MIEENILKHSKPEILFFYLHFPISVGINILRVHKQTYPVASLSCSVQVQMYWIWFVFIPHCILLNDAFATFQICCTQAKHTRAGMCSHTRTKNFMKEEIKLKFSLLNPFNFDFDSTNPSIIFTLCPVHDVWKHLRVSNKVMLSW